MTKLARILGVVMLLVLVAAGPALAARPASNRTFRWPSAGP